MSDFEYVYVYDGTYMPIPYEIYHKSILKANLVCDIFEQIEYTKELDSVHKIF